MQKFVLQFFLQLSYNLLLKKSIPPVFSTVKPIMPIYINLFFKTGFLKNSGNFSGKHLRLSFFLKKLQDFKSATSLKRDSNTGVFLKNLGNF